MTWQSTQLYFFTTEYTMDDVSPTQLLTPGQNSTVSESMPYFSHNSASTGERGRSCGFAEKACGGMMDPSKATAVKILSV